MSAADIALAAAGWICAFCFVTCLVCLTITLVRDVWRDWRNG